MPRSVSPVLTRYVRVQASVGRGVGGGAIVRLAAGVVIGPALGISVGLAASVGSGEEDAADATDPSTPGRLPPNRATNKAETAMTMSTTRLSCPSVRRSTR